MRTASLSALLVLAALPHVARARQDALPPPSAEITADELHHHVAFLASDELRGRETGTPELRRAALYLASALQRAGVAPAGADDGFLQPVPLERVVHAAVPELEVRTPEGEPLEAVFGRDFTVQVRGEPRSTAALALLHATSAEELPAAADGQRALWLDGSSRERRAWLTERGMGEAEGWGLYVRLSSRRPGNALEAVPPGRLALAASLEGASGESDPCEVLSLRGALRTAAEEGRIGSLRLTLHAERERVLDQNVVGRLAGVGTPEHPELAGQVLVLSAHFDHIGVAAGAAEGEDAIFNGADDDASGTAVVLAIAEALGAGPPPARTVVFLLATGEERGLLGTRWYLDHPVEPLDRTVCNLNFEMVGRADELAGGPGKLWLTGFEHTNLGPLFQAAGLTVVRDPRPEQNFYQRSDNYAFVQRGIVGQTLSSYNMHADYHHVSDEADTLDYEHMESAARNCLKAVRSLASGEVTPSWTASAEEEPAEDARGR